jgi:hypothetical protein
MVNQLLMHIATQATTYPAQIAFQWTPQSNNAKITTHQIYVITATMDIGLHQTPQNVYLVVKKIYIVQELETQVTTLSLYWHAAQGTAI